MSFTKKGIHDADVTVSIEPDRTGNLISDGTDEGEIIQAAIDLVVDNFGGGGEILIKGAFNNGDQDITIPSIDTDVIIRGLGRRVFADAIAGARQCRSYIEFSGATKVTNALGDWNRGNLIFRDMGLIFNGLTNTPGILTDYCPVSMENVLVYEEGGTYADFTDALISCGSTTPATPDGHISWLDDVTFSLKSTGATCYYPHTEVSSLGNVTVGFYGSEQMFWEVAGVQTHSLNHLHYWLGEDAEDCKVFELFNDGKTVTIGTISGSSQAGAGVTTPNVLFGVRAGQTYNSTYLNYNVRAIDAVVNWGQTPAAAIYLWENDDTQERTLISDMFSNEYVKGKVTIPFMNERASVNLATPGVAYVVFDADMSTTISLDYVQHARVCGKAIGDEGGADKGVAIYNITDGAVLAEHEWTGAASEEFEGLWTNVDQVGDTQLNVYVKASSVTEDIALTKAWLEVR